MLQWNIKRNFGRIADVGEDYVLNCSDSRSDAESTVSVSIRKVTETMLETFMNAEGRIIVACVAVIFYVFNKSSTLTSLGRKIF